MDCRNGEEKQACVPFFAHENVLTFLGLIGVIVDPTTAGIGDSNRAMSYTEPWEDPDPVILEGMDPDADDQPCPPPPKGVD